MALIYYEVYFKFNSILYKPLVVSLKLKNYFLIVYGLGKLKLLTTEEILDV